MNAPPRAVPRSVLHAALAPAQRSAFLDGEYVGQESFVSASEVRRLATVAGIGPGVRVLDLCCGIAGPGRHLVETSGARYVGVDADEDAVLVARKRTSGLDCRFLAASVPPLPPGPFDVVLLLETFLAFADKGTLVRGVAEVLERGGRFAFTVETGRPLSEEERRRMPAADTVRLLPLPDLLRCVEANGFRLVWQDDVTSQHLVVASALATAYEARATDIERRVGRPALEQLLVAHRLWVEWLADRRVGKFAVVAEKVS